MHINSLHISNFRNITAARLDPHPRLNVFFGDNGAGKTSILESIYLVARGKSFRTGRAEELIGPAEDGFRVFVGLERNGSRHRLGLERDARQWRARRDGRDVTLLSELSRDLPVVLMEPNSHQLVSGPPEGRRRFLDWGVFHVEPSYLETWRRYARALRQRNAALRSRDARLLDGLDTVLAESGEQLGALRARYFARLSGAFAGALDGEKSALRNITLEFDPGWRGDSLAAALEHARSRDLDQGVTSQGAHRAELGMVQDGQPVRSRLSRGEQKGLAAALLLTQARLFGESGDRPVVLVDDLASEFDKAHLEKVLATACGCAEQIWITGVTRLTVSGAHAAFHVEHGTVREMV